jgi:hypothetical protein
VTFPPKTTPLAKKLDYAVMGRKEEAHDSKAAYREQIITVHKDAQAGIGIRRSAARTASRMPPVISGGPSMRGLKSAT